ncbi:putative solute carrier family 40 (iron-regulated transporter) protein [Eutypa lata UCREL1]|uniref:Solute carrier family 40 member n=1 Tax=Eutypa lata (strain UCR-EL1) TaxID=1287681 RepID=M7SVR0_EUTLA|nr:putative solute carrier family 40 (iron-regulated transporter) protein [Eutypa lata UCREL1]
MVEDDEYELRSESPNDDITEHIIPADLSRSQAWNLMIIIYFAMIVFSSSIGRWVDRSPNRLRTLLSTIVCNRGSVLVGSVFWLLILSQEDLVGADGVFSVPSNGVIKGVGFALAVSCGIVERLSASGNLISMERDWVVAVAAPSGSGRPYDLTHLNAVMRRIDLVCKLFAPIVISVIISARDSVRVGVLFTGLTSLVSLPIETISARRVWKSSLSLQAPKPVPPEPQHTTTPQMQQRSGSFVTGVRQYFKGFEMYFGTSVWIPSVALALLHFNMLTWRATFITSLINVGYSLNAITIARTVGSVFEISSTLVTPYGIVYLGKAQQRQHGSPLAEEEEEEEEEDEAGVGLIGGNKDDDDDDENLDAQTIVGLTRFGLWGFTWQLINMIPVVLAVWAIYPHPDSDSESSSPAAPPPPPSRAWSLALFAFLAFSRFGVWIFDLTTQQLTQTLVPAHERSTFAGVENSVVSVFELLGAGAAVALPRTAQFAYLALASFAAVAGAWAIYLDLVNELGKSR